MQVIVLIAGVADPKRPITKPVSGNWLELISCGNTPFKLSPFDEAALEIALKLRDKNSAVKINVIVTDGSNDLAMMRTIAALRPDNLRGLAVEPDYRGDPSWLAQTLKHALMVDGVNVDLWLIGREHGDLDDGVIPGFLGELWQIPFIGLVLGVKIQGSGSLKLERLSRGQTQTIELHTPAILSITNDKDNRLRHPLMKNVMLAKQLKFEIIIPSADSFLQKKQFLSVQPTESSRRESHPCTMLDGSTQEQANSLVAYLKEWQKSSFILKK